MNWDRVEGNWRQLRGKFKEQWGVLTESQLEIVAGKRERLIGVLQESYGISKDEAERQVKEWENSEQRAAAFEQVLRRNGELV
ncbi:MAG: CsbD family protein [Betaproteobacteria bacterium]|nr:CsbD family protein [Betaproteobacteria bacterium]